MFCKKCGKYVQPNENFCPYCGAEVEKAVGTGAQRRIFRRGRRLV